MKIQTIDVFQLAWGENGKGPRSAFVRVVTDDGIEGYGEASPMHGGRASLQLINEIFGPALIGQDPLDHAVLLDTLWHKAIKLGPQGIATGALAALDIALWDIKGKAFNLPIYKLLGGAWRTEMPIYSSIGNNGERTIAGVLELVEQRVREENPTLVKIRFDGDRTRLDADVEGDITKARAVRKLLGDEFPLAFDGNNRYSVGGAMRVGRVLEELGFRWFEEPVQHYHVGAMGEVARRLDITVSAGEQSYTLQEVKDLIEAGVRMVQPDIVKMGGITGLMQCLALCNAHGVELVPHQTQPSLGQAANLHVVAAQMHMSRPVENADSWQRTRPAFENPIEPVNGRFSVPEGPGLGLRLRQSDINTRRVAV